MTINYERIFAKFIQKYVDVNIDVSEILNSENNKEVKAGLDISESKTEEL